METEQTQQRRPNELGEWGRRAAANIADLRQRSGMSQGEPAAAMTRLGRHITRGIVSKAEVTGRRIDADDLAAFALALGYAPNRLLLPGTASAEQVIEVSPGRYVTELDTWQWALGDKPLEGGSNAEFVAENRPSRAPELAPTWKIFENADLARVITRTASHARRLSVSLAELHIATASAYLTDGGD